MSTYSKTFGLTFINDDHFFASVAIVQNVFNGGCRIFWGYFYDKAGFKKCFLFIGLTVTVVTALLPTLPYLGTVTIVKRLGTWMGMGNGNGKVPLVPGIDSIILWATHIPDYSPTQLLTMKECSGRKVLIEKVSQNDPLY